VVRATQARFDARKPFHQAAQAAVDAAVVALSQRYLWWTPALGHEHSIDRRIAQIMNWGTEEDCEKLDTLVGPDRIAWVMLHAAPGWIREDRWTWWRDRLPAIWLQGIPDKPPVRSFPRT